ncbi:MAG: flagellar hook-length control protein FliK [Thermoguttaceae bacterium]
MMTTTSGSSVSSTRQLSDSYNALHLQFAQMDTFLEYLQDMADERSEQRAEQLREERLSVQRQQPLQESLLEMLSNEETEERREELEKASEQQRQRVDDLNRAENRKMLRNRSDESKDRGQNVGDVLSVKQGVARNDFSTEGKGVGAVWDQNGLLNNRSELQLGQSNPFGTPQSAKWSPNSLVTSLATPPTPTSVLSETAGTSLGTNVVQSADWRTGNNHSVVTNDPTSQLSPLTQRADSSLGMSQGGTLQNGMQQHATVQGPIDPKSTGTLDMPRIVQANTQSVSSSETSVGVLASFSEMSVVLANAVRNSSSQNILNKNNTNNTKQAAFRLGETKPGQVHLTGQSGINKSKGQFIENEQNEQIGQQGTPEKSNLLGQAGSALLSSLLDESPFSVNRGIEELNRGGGVLGTAEEESGRGKNVSKAASTETGSTTSSQPGLTLDKALLPSQPSKSAPSFVAALDQVLTNRTRRTGPVDDTVSDSIRVSMQQHFMQQRSSSSQSEDGVTGQTQENRPMQEQFDRVRFVQRVANACQSAANQNGPIRMKLHPESLGSLTVRIQVRNKMMNVRMEAETENARMMLLEHLDLLKERLLEQGVEIGSFEVEVKEQNKHLE